MTSKCRAVANYIIDEINKITSNSSDASVENYNYDYKSTK